MLGGCSISWKATFQSIIALLLLYLPLRQSTVGLRGLYEELTSSQGTAVIHYDNESAIHIFKDQMLYKRTKHVDVK